MSHVFLYLNHYILQEKHKANTTSTGITCRLFGLYLYNQEDHQYRVGRVHLDFQGIQDHLYAQENPYCQANLGTPEGQGYHNQVHPADTHTYALVTNFFRMFSKNQCKVGLQNQLRVLL